MKWNMIFGALVVSVGLCSQSFGFELLDRMLGYRSGGCGGCNSCCEATCCDAEPSCCAAEPTCCAAEPACCAAEPSCCEAPACDSCNSCNSCDSGCGHKHCGLFGGLKGMFACHGCKKSCAPACEPTCCEAEPACCAAEPTCCEAPACDSCNSCNSGCSKKKCCGGLLGGLFHCKKKSCCKTSCCQTSCCDNNGCAGGGCNSCGGGAPAAAESGSDVPPAPPVADQSASVRGKRRVVQTSSVARRN